MKNIMKIHLFVMVMVCSFSMLYANGVDETKGESCVVRRPLPLVRGQLGVQDHLKNLIMHDQEKLVQSVFDNELAVVQATDKILDKLECLYRKLDMHSQMVAFVKLLRKLELISFFECDEKIEKIVFSQADKILVQEFLTGKQGYGLPSLSVELVERFFILTKRDKEYNHIIEVRKQRAEAGTGN